MARRVNAHKLTERQKSNIRSAYLEGGISQSVLAKKYGVGRATISKLLREDMDATQKRTEIKEQEEERCRKDLVEHIRERYSRLSNLFDKAIERAEEALPEATAREAFGGIKIVCDVATATALKDATGPDEPIQIQIVERDMSGG